MHFQFTSAVDLVADVVRIQGVRTIQCLTGLIISTQWEINPCEIPGQKKVSRIQLTCSLEVVHGVEPPSLSSIYPSSHFKKLCIVRQSASRIGKLGPSAVVVEISPIEMQSQGQVRLA